MSRNTKVILLVVLPLIASCCLLCVLGTVLGPALMSQSFTEDSAKAKQVAARIAEYDLPSGYRERMGVDFLFYQMVTIGRNDKRGVSVTLIQMGLQGASSAQMEQQMRQSFQNQYGASAASMKYVYDRPVMIKGKQTAVTVSENSEGTREAAGAFQGRNGIVIVMVFGRISEWDWPTIESFLASIR